MSWCIIKEWTDRRLPQVLTQFNPKQTEYPAASFPVSSPHVEWTKVHLASIQGSTKTELWYVTVDVSCTFGEGEDESTL